MPLCASAVGVSYCHVSQWPLKLLPACPIFLCYLEGLLDQNPASWTYALLFFFPIVPIFTEISKPVFKLSLLLCTFLVFFPPNNSCLVKCEFLKVSLPGDCGVTISLCANLILRAAMFLAQAFFFLLFFFEPLDLGSF